jgi:hypothetical protein
MISLKLPFCPILPSKSPKKRIPNASAFSPLFPNLILNTFMFSVPYRAGVFCRKAAALYHKKAEGKNVYFRKLPGRIVGRLRPSLTSLPGGSSLIPPERGPARPAWMPASGKGGRER